MGAEKQMPSFLASWVHQFWGVFSSVSKMFPAEIPATHWRSSLIKEHPFGVPVVVHSLKNLTSIYESAGLISGLAQWVKDPVLPVSCGVGCRRGWDPALLWLWRRPAATALMRPLAWESPYVVGAALKRQKEKEKQTLMGNHCILWHTTFGNHRYSVTMSIFYVKSYYFVTLLSTFSKNPALMEVLILRKIRWEF